jgi:hypothetical protein
MGIARVLLPLVLVWPVAAADLPGSQDPPGIKRYTGSEIIGYRAPKTEEFLMPLGKAVQPEPPGYTKSEKVQGLLSRYTYLAPQGTSPEDLFQFYQAEFQRLNLDVLFTKGKNANGWFGPTLKHPSDEDGLGEILIYDEAQERVLTAKSKDPQPVWYTVFVTMYKVGDVPARLRDSVKPGRALAQVVVVAPGAK